MKYPVSVVTGGANDWRVIYPDGKVYATCATEADANHLRDLLNENQAPAPVARPVAAFCCWGYSLDCDGKPYNADADWKTAKQLARNVGTIPVQGRFIPDNLTPAELRDEAARLLTLAGVPCGGRVREHDCKIYEPMAVEYERSGPCLAIRWTGSLLEDIGLTFFDQCADASNEAAPEGDGTGRTQRD